MLFGTLDYVEANPWSRVPSSLYGSMAAVKNWYAGT